MLARFVKANFGLIIIFFVVLVLFVTNFTPGTYLTGWDNLQTDLNPTLGIKRSFFSVWQEYQSFGLTSGLAHAADLVRSVFIWSLSLILPTQFLRYFYHFLMVFIGGAGTFYLLKRVIKENEGFAILGALFYILNFGTLQILYIPWESFSTFFAFLPWEFLIFIKILENPKDRKNYFFFLLINFISTPQFYIQTIFIVYISLLSLFSIGRYIETKSIETLKNSAFLLLSIILINAFWLLPQIYSFLTQSDVVTNAKNNLLATENVVYQNLEKGTLLHFIRMEGFYSDLYGKAQTFLFLPWKEHFQNIYASGISLLLSLIFIFGIIAAFFRKKLYRISFLLLFILIAIGLLGKFPVFEQIDDLARKQYIINQVFRSPFTKFSILYALIASYGLVMGISTLYYFLQKHKINIPKNVVVVFFFILIIAYSFPSFKGNYISKEMKVKIPSAYAKLTDFFKNENKNKRIALLPDYTSLGWFNYKWGYSGSGFLWYAIEQPIVSRTFDVWSNKSESYFWEEKLALEAEDPEKFEKVLEKYNIDYLLYDKSLLPIVGNTRSIQYDRLDSILAKSKSIELIKQLDFISIYKVSHGKKINNFLAVSSQLPNIGPRTSISNDDTAYLDYGEYMTDSKEPFQTYYPFLNLSTQTTISQKYWNIFESASEFIFTSSLPFDPKQYSAMQKANDSAEFNLYINDNLSKFVLPFSKSLENNNLIVRFPKVKISQFDLTKEQVKNCSKNNGVVLKDNQDKFVIVRSQMGATACIAYTDEQLSQEYGYLVKVNNENITGQRLFFYVLDTTKEQSYLEDILRKNDENFIIAPRFKYGKGYSFIFHNNSYENIGSENKIKSLEVYLIPYSQIKNTVLQRTNTPTQNIQPQTEFKTDKINYYSYRITGKGLAKNNTIILYQAFDPGWKAYEVKNNGFLNSMFPFVFGKEVKDHVLVNNWANGWTLDSSFITNHSSLYIVYLPQYLEYLGFLILLLVPIYLFRLK